MAESLRHPQMTPVWLDRFRPWILIATIALIVVAYGPQLDRADLERVVQLTPDRARSHA